MRIGLSTTMIQRGHTGIGQYSFALLRAIAALPVRHHFNLFVLEEDLPLFQFLQPAMNVIPVAETWRKPAQNIFWHQSVLPKLARNLRLDVLHVPSYRRLIWSSPCATVATIHDLAPFRLPKKYDWKRMLYGKRIVPFLARRQNKIIAISKTTAADIRSYFQVDPQRLHVIYNGVNHERFNPGNISESRTRVQEKHGIKEPFFLYVARLEHPGKNHVRLIAAFNQFKQASRTNHKLVLAGSDWHGAETIHAMIRQSPWTKDIIHLGFVQDQDLASFYRAAEAFVFPSLVEGFGMPVIEAMACGCPVICSSDGALGEVAGDAALGLRDAKDVDELALHLASVARDARLRNQLRASGLRRAEEFDWKTTAEATLDVYRQAYMKAGSLMMPRVLTGTKQPI
jgi:glycosyltransferase involved in cell wall biosynthesis